MFSLFSISPSAQNNTQLVLGSQNHWFTGDPMFAQGFPSYLWTGHHGIPYSNTSYCPTTHSPVLSTETSSLLQPQISTEPKKETDWGNSLPGPGLAMDGTDVWKNTRRVGGSEIIIHCSPLGQVFYSHSANDALIPITNVKCSSWDLGETEH